jgi:hypothetical protein
MVPHKKCYVWQLAHIMTLIGYQIILYIKIFIRLSLDLTKTKRRYIIAK